MSVSPLLSSNFSSAWRISSSVMDPAAQTIVFHAKALPWCYNVLRPALLNKNSFRNVPNPSQIYAKSFLDICQILARYMPNSSQKYAKSFLDICQILPRYMPNPSLIYAKSFLDVCQILPRYAKSFLDICQILPNSFAASDPFS